MKQILAVIKPTRLDPVRDALKKVGVNGMTAADARGFGAQGGIVDSYRGVEYRIDWIQKVRIDVVVPDNLLEAAVGAIKEGAFTGAIGDGKIFVSPVESVYRIRTNEVDEAALA